MCCAQPDWEGPDRVTLTIGKMAGLAGVSPDTLRYYEREQLIRPSAKSRSGYRLYERDALRRIRFIKQAQQCGFSLSEIRSLLALRTNTDARCRDLRRLAVEKQLQIDSKIKAMKAMSKALRHLIDECKVEERPLNECPILAALERANGARVKPR
jgi:MerR family Zn(II)-responsive transcriptional regulator of zntA